MDGVVQGFGGFRTSGFHRTNQRDQSGVQSALTTRTMGRILRSRTDTDSLYIDLSERPSVDSREVSAGIMLD